MVITIPYPSIANCMYLCMQCIWPHAYFLLTEFIRDTYICIHVQSDIPIHGFANCNDPSIVALLHVFVIDCIISIYNKTYSIAEASNRNLKVN